SSDLFKCVAGFGCYRPYVVTRCIQRLGSVVPVWCFSLFVIMILPALFGRKFCFVSFKVIAIRMLAGLITSIVSWWHVFPDAAIESSADNEFLRWDAQAGQIFHGAVS